MGSEAYGGGRPARNSRLTGLSADGAGGWRQVRCIQKYCSGWRRTAASSNAMNFWVTASRSYSSLPEGAGKRKGKKRARF